MKEQIQTVKTVKAHLTETITYNKDGIEISVPSGTLILVDTASGVALIAEDHVDIYPEEYQAIPA